MTNLFEFLYSYKETPQILGIGPDTYILIHILYSESFYLHM